MEEKQLLQQLVQAADDKKAENIVALDMEGVSVIAKYFVVCNGGSEKQVDAIAQAVKKAAQEQGFELKRLEGLDSSRWVLIDAGDIVVHVFHQEERQYYNLEKLWIDAKEVDVNSLLSV
ncbi:ribosome silencing factor [Texcoconibacillus texcoconensis]|uniref:Ribosomal silencing factor RsfS n=1 Tax=Texcoconibacillus texcoconensis TaxID=1095777 RepID=A0A840QRL0_9BACI|nr:ribosome silencing factor [Texcoconibacillus texcoconensis]MBB5173968.1 ribosome-associated protein [Texcoconibacillus texcoconensis]